MKGKLIYQEIKNQKKTTKNYVINLDLKKEKIIINYQEVKDEITLLVDLINDIITIKRQGHINYEITHKEKEKIFVPIQIILGENKINLKHFINNKKIRIKKDKKKLNLDLVLEITMDEQKEEIKNNYTITWR